METPVSKFLREFLELLLAGGRLQRDTETILVPLSLVELGEEERPFPRGTLSAVEEAVSALAFGERTLISAVHFPEQKGIREGGASRVLAIGEFIDGIGVAVHCIIVRI